MPAACAEAVVAAPDRQSRSGAEVVMSIGMTLVNFRNGQRDSIPRDAIVSLLVRHGCKVP